MKKKIVALVPMRHHSQRVSCKNYREFVGKPLYFWILQTLLDCPSIDLIYINTDSSVIKEDINQWNDRIHIIDRPQNLCDDEVPMNDILFHDINCIESDYYLQTHATNPLLTKETIEKSIGMFLGNSDCDSLFSVTKLQTRLWDKEGHPINHNLKELKQTQDLDPVFEENSNLYLFSKESFQENKNRIGKKPLMFEIEGFESIDIDEEIDFKLAEQLKKLRGK